MNPQNKPCAGTSKTNVFHCGRHGFECIWVSGFHMCVYVYVYVYVRRRRCCGTLAFACLLFLRSLGKFSTCAYTYTSICDRSCSQASDTRKYLHSCIVLSRGVARPDVIEGRAECSACSLWTNSFACRRQQGFVHTTRPPRAPTAKSTPTQKSGAR